MVVLPGFWAGKRVLVSGHTGFKGSWLTFWLKSLGAQVLGYSLEADTQPNLFSVANIDSGMVHQVGDIRDADHIKSVVSEFKPEIVFHLAAQALVRNSYDDPHETFSTNVLGSLNVLEAIRATPSVKAVVNVTTDKCYDNQEWMWPYRENEPLGGKDPYSASKACAEILANSYTHSFFESPESARMATARAGNVIGGGDWSADRLIPDAMRSFSQGRSVEIRNPVSIRPWQHVLDALNGYLILAQKLFGDDGQDYVGAYNFGPDYSGDANVLAVVTIARDIWGQGASIEVADVPSGPHEAKYLRLDSSKARNKLAWTTQWNLQQSLAHTVEWYRHFYEGKPIASLMHSQIEEISPSNAPVTSMDD